MKPYQATKLHAMIDELIECSIDHARALTLSQDERHHRAILKDKARNRVNKYILKFIKVKA